MSKKSKNTQILNSVSALGLMPQSHKERLGLQALEPRILLDAAGFVTGAEVAMDAISSSDAQMGVEAIFAPEARVTNEASEALIRALESEIGLETAQFALSLNDEVKASDYVVPLSDIKDASTSLEAVESFADSGNVVDYRIPVSDLKELVQDMAATLEAGPDESAVVFVDATIQGYQTLIDDLPEGTEVILIEADIDGVEFIANTLQNRSDIDAVHILSHGAAGEITLGTATLNSESIAGEYADELTIIRNALSADADILLYGCDFGADIDAVNALALATGADIAASNDDTGAAALGGDWNLEIKTGDVDTDTFALRNFAGLLATVPETVTPDSVTSTDAEVTGLENTIDGEPAGSLFAQDFTSDVSNVTYNFATGQDGVTDIVIWNNAGGNLTDGQSIGAIGTINIRDTDGNIILTLTNIIVPEGAAGNPFTLNLGASLDNVGSIELLNLTDTSGGLPGIAWREVAIIKQLLDTDGDGVADINDVDDDNDGILDVDEGFSVITEGDQYVDYVIRFDQVGPTGPFDDPNDVLGAPDGEPTSLGGTGSELVVGYLGAVLTNNGDSNPDLALIEIGAIEETEVSLRPTEATRILLDAQGVLTPDSEGFYSFGIISGSAPIDIDAATLNAFAAGELEFDAIKFTGNNDAGGAHPGPDIDGVEAFSVRVFRQEVTRDTDNDGIADHLDIDSDNDGITDNIEAQSTAGYIAPSGIGADMTDVNGDGLDDNYGGNFEDVPRVARQGNLFFDHNNIPFPGELQANNSDGHIVSGSAVNFGAGLTASTNGSATTLVGTDHATLEAAIAAEAYIQYDITTSDDSSRLLALTAFNTYGPRFDGSAAILLDGELVAEFDYVNTGSGTGFQDFDFSNLVNLQNDTTHTIQIVIYGAPNTVVIDSYNLNLAVADVLVPVDTDGDGDADYIDTDSDNDGRNDTVEAGLGNSPVTGLSNAATDADGDGLFDVFDTQNGTAADDGFDVNESIAAGAAALPDSDGDASGGIPLSEDVDFRDTPTDTDGDGVADVDDVDDDNDGILDVDEDLETTFTALNSSLGNFNGVRIFDATPTTSRSGAAFSDFDLGETFPGGPVMVSSPGNAGALRSFTVDFPDGIEGEVFLAALNIDFHNFSVFDQDGNPVAVTLVDATNDTRVSGNTISDVNPSTYSNGNSASGIFRLEGSFTSLRIVRTVVTPGATDGFVISFAQLLGGRDTDSDGIVDRLDIDSDNDGITDNIEAQSTAGYIAPNADDAATYAANNGLNSAYLASNGLTAVDTDNDGDADYLDTDSDDDGRDDTFEAGLGNSPVTGLSTDANDADGDGLFDVFDTQNGTAADDGFDVNESLAAGAAALPDADGDAGGGVPLSEDVDFRDVPTSPVLDLNSAASDTDTDRGFTSEYTSGTAAVSIVDIDADALEGSDVAGFTFLTITPTSALPDGANEILQVAGVDIPLNADFAQGGFTIPGTSTVVDISYVDGVLTVRESSNGIIANADMDALIRSVTYRNEAANLDDSIARTFDFQAAQYDPSTFIIDFEEFTAGERVTSAQIESSAYWGSEGVTNTGQDTLNGYVAANGVRTGALSSPLSLAANADGNFLFHNTFGLVPTGENVVFGRSDISVDPNTEYTISLDLGRVNAVAAGPFQIVVDDVVIGTVSNIPTNNFQTYTFSFTSGSTSSVDFEIRNLSTNPTGNDFGIDNISFQREPLILSNVATATVDLISAVPPEAEDDAFTLHENPEGAEAGTIANGNLLADNGSGVDSDVNGDTLSITQINGVDISNGQQITLASGALLTIRTDGTFDYDPNGAFDSLSDGDIGTETFTYTLSDGTTAPTDSATVTITINGDNDAPIIDLNGPNTPGVDYQAVFVEDQAGQPLANLLSVDAIIQDDEDNIAQINIVPNLPVLNDGADEFIRINTDDIDLTIRLSDGQITATTPLVFGDTTFDVSYVNGEIVITNAEGGTINSDDLEGFLRLLSYQNVNQNNSEGVRAFEFQVIDPAGVTFATSYISVERANDAPVPTVSNTSNGTVAEVGSDTQPDPILIVTPESAALSDALTETEVLDRLANGETAADLGLISVSDLLAQLDITDAEQTEFGIGIISANEDQGRWQYLRTDVPGHEWTDFQLGDQDNTDLTPIPDGQVLLMDADTVLRFIPNPGFRGGAEIEFRVWDGTEGTASNPPSTVADDSGGTAPMNTSSLSSSAFSAMLAADTDSDGIINADDVDDDNDGILDVDEGLIDSNLAGPVPDGVEDTGFPIGYWSVQYYEGRSPIPGATNGTTTVTHIGEAYFGYGQSSTFINIGGADNTVPSGENYIAEVPGFVASSTPISGTPGNYEVVHRRTVTADGVLSFGGRPVDDAIRVVIDGVIVFNYYPGGGSPDPRPGDPPFTPVNIAVSAGSEVEIIYQNLGGQGGYGFTLDTPVDAVTVRDTDNDGIADHLDIDSDDDGITDNVEAQATDGYIAPTGQGTGITDVNMDGLDDIYDTRNGSLTATSSAATSAEAVIAPVDTDGLGGADYVDPDSDNDGIADVAERGDAGPTTYMAGDTDGDGLADVFEGTNVNDGFDVNDENVSVPNGLTVSSLGEYNLSADPDLAADLSNVDGINTNLTFRDQLDTDGDGVADIRDVDKDNDGILDVLEGIDTVSFSQPPYGTSVYTGTTTIGVDVSVELGVVPPFFPASRTNIFDNDNFTFLGDQASLPSAEVFYDASQIDGFPTTMELSFSGENVVEVYLHVNSIDQFLLNYTPPPGIGVEVLSSVNASIVNHPDGTITIGGSDATAMDTSTIEEEQDGIGAGSVDGTLRFFSLDGSPITSLELVLTQDPNNVGNDEGWQFAVEVAIDSDGDGIADYCDIDSDNDGITDNIEAQTTADYIAPSGVASAMVDANGDGLDDNYDNRTVNGVLGAGESAATAAEAVILPVNSDAGATTPDSTPDYVDTDSDNDGRNDTLEAGLGAAPATGLSSASTDADGDGLFDVFETQLTGDTDDGFNVNENVSPLDGTLPDAGGDASVGMATPLVNDLDYRDPNDNPIAENDAVGGVENATIIFDVFADNGVDVDSDPEGDTFVITRAASGNNEAVLASLTDGTGLSGTVAGSNGGVFSVLANGTMQFNPGTDFEDLAVGETRVTEIVYQIDDGNGGTDTAVVTYTVMGENDPVTPVIPGNPNPPADPNNYIPAQAGVDSTAITPLDLTPYFADADTSDTVTLTINPADLPAGLSFDGTSISGTPNADASQGGVNGVYTIPVTATDSNGSTITTYVTYTITNPAPVAENDGLGGTESETADTFDVFANNGVDVDSDPDGDSFSITRVLSGNNEMALAGVANGTGVSSAVAGSTGGLFTIAANGTATFDANGDFEDLAVGETRVTEVVYQIDDGEGGTDTAVVTYTVMGENDPVTPVIPGNPNPPVDPNNYIPAQAGVDTTAITPLDLTPYFADADTSDTVTLTINPADLPAGLSFDGTSISGTPDADASQGGVNGVYTIPVTATDSNGSTITSYVTYTITNPAPVAENDALTATEDDLQITGSVFANNANGPDTDPDGDTITVTEVAGNPANVGQAIAGSNGGEFTLNSDGSYVFTPNGDFEGLDVGETATTTVTYMISDGEGGTDTATVTVTVQGRNDAPVLINPLDPNDPNPVIPSQMGNDSEALMPLDVSDYFTDPDGELTFFDLENAPSWMTVNPLTGVITGTPPLDASQNGPANDGVYPITIIATDADGTETRVVINYTIANPAPVAQDDAATANEDGPVVSGNVITDDTGNGVDSDVDGDALSVAEVGGDPALIGQPVAGSIGGQFTVNADGSYSFDPNGEFEYLAVGETATTTLTYLLTDADGATDLATITVTVEGSNDAPIPVDPTQPVGPSDPTDPSDPQDPRDPPVDPQNYIPAQTGTDGVPFAPFNLTPYFGDPDGSDVVTLSIDPAELPNGMSFDPVTGLLSGTPSADASQGGTAGVYSIPVTATDPSGESFTTIIQVTISNPGPTAMDDIEVTDEDNVLSDSVLPNNGNGPDTDPDGDVLTVAQVNGAPITSGSVITLPSGALLTMNADGSYDYDPNGQFEGLAAGESDTDSFTYQITDSQGGVSEATVTLTIEGVNDAPIPVDPTQPVGPSDPTDPFDPQDPRDPPIDPQNYIPAQTAQDGSPVTPIDLTPYFGDPDGSDVVTLSIDPADLPAGLSFDGTSISGTPDADASQGGMNGVYTIPVTATDPSGESFMTFVTYTVTNPAPEAMNDTFSTAEDTPITVNIIDNDVDPDGDTLVVDAVGLPDGTIIPVGVPTDIPQGTLTVMPDGTTTFEPARDYVGPVVFGYTVSDGEGGTDVATVTFNVTPVNDAPIPVDPTQPIAEPNNPNFPTDPETPFEPPLDPENYIPVQAGNDGAPTTPLDLTPYFGDPDPMEPLVISLDPSELPSGLSFDPATGIISGTPAADASQGGDSNNPGTYVIAVTVTDPSGETFTTNVTYVVENPSPIATNDGPLEVIEDTPTVLDILGNDSDPDGDDLVITEINGTPVTVGQPVTLPSGATVTLNPDGTIEYEPVENYNGPDSFTYTISDGEGGTDMAEVTLDVTPVNDAPELDLNGAEAGVDETIIVANDDASTPIIPDSFVTDIDSVTLASFTGTVGGNVDGAGEAFTLGGEDLAIGTGGRTFNITQGGTTFTVVSDGTSFTATVSGGTGDIADVDALMATLSYEHTQSPPTLGNRTVTLSVTDDQGLVSNDAVVTIQLVPDTTAPLPPTIDAEHDNETGLVAVTGTGEPGATITLTFPNGEMVETIVDADGNYSASSLTPQPDGDVIAIQADEAGNISEAVDDDYVNQELIFVEDQIPDETDQDTAIESTRSDIGQPKSDIMFAVKRYFQDFITRTNNGFDREPGDTLRTGYSTESGHIDDTTDGLIVQTVTFEHNINVQLTAKLVEAQDVKSWSVSLADGGPLPSWVEYVPGSDFFEMTRPLGQGSIKLTVRAILDNGRTVSKIVSIDMGTGVVEDEGGTFNQAQTLNDQLTVETQNFASENDALIKSLAS